MKAITINNIRLENSNVQSKVYSEIEWQMIKLQFELKSIYLVIFSNSVLRLFICPIIVLLVLSCLASILEYFIV